MQTKHSASTSSLTLALMTMTASSFATASLDGGDSAANASGNSTPQPALDTVIVTGTRVDDKKAKDSAVPITILGAQEIKNSGKANLLEALQTLLPSFNLPTNIQPDLGSIVRGAQLRNLSPAYTLVLVNGVRRNTSAAYTGAFPGDVYVDLSLIPMTAIDHIELLRDGASALYGADAVAGVINIILKKDPEGGQVSLEGGQSYRSDGGRAILRANEGFGFGGAGWANVSLESIRQNIAITNPPLNPTYLSYPAVNPGTGALVPLGKNNSLPAGATPNPAEATRNNSPWINQGIFPYTLLNLALDAGYDISPDFQLYGFATYSHRKAETPENFRLPNTIFINNPGALSLYPDGFTPWEGMREDDYAVSGGAKGNLAGWEWDYSITYDKDAIDTYTWHSLNFSLTYPGGPTDFYDGYLGFNQLNSNLDFKRSFDLGFLPRKLDVSFGFEYENDQYRYLPGEPDSYTGVGAASEVGNKPVDQAITSRHDWAGYLGASTHLTDRWEVDLAARFQRYSDFGGVPNFGLSTRFNFTDQFALRGSVSNGFKAPSLVAESYTNTNDRNGATYAVVRPSSAIGEALGATPLQAEKARNYSAGFVWDPADWIDVTVDAYQIDVKNQLGQSPTIGLNTSTNTDGSGNTLTPAQVDFIKNQLLAFGVDPGILQTGYFVNYFTNVGNLRTRGVDINATASQSGTPWGDFRYTFAANLNTNRLTSQPPLPAALQAFPNISLLTASSINSLVNLAPKHKFIADVQWHQGTWHADLKETLYGPLRLIGTVPYKLGSIPVTDASIGKELGHGFSVDVGATDLFNRKADKVPAWAQSAATLAQYPYTFNTSGPVSSVGGYYYVRATYTF